MHLPTKVSVEISEFVDDHCSQHPEDYAVVYGSSVYSPDKVTSDVDMFLVSRDADNVAIDSLVAFIKDLHLKNGRSLDAEVPYENKVLYSLAEIDSAVNFSGFEVIDGKIVVPEVKKEAEFLQSDQIKARLALNGLTTPHVVFGKDFAQYHEARVKAGLAITILAISLSEQSRFNLDDLRDALVVGDDGQSGEMFLGYKTEYPIVDEHLVGILNAGLKRLIGCNAIEPWAGGYNIDSKIFDPLMCAQTSYNYN